MWLLILAVVILTVSALVIARYERAVSGAPAAMAPPAGFIVRVARVIWSVCLVMLVFAVGWKWALIGLGVWFLVVFLLMFVARTY